MPVRFTLHLLKFAAAWLYRILAVAAVVCALVFVALILLLRYWILPSIDTYRSRIVQAVSEAAQQRIDIGRIEGEWDGLRPRLILHDLRLLDREGRERLRLEEVDSTLAWLSLITGELQFYAIELQQLKLEARRTAAGDLEVAGIMLGHSGEPGGSGLGDWLLRQHRIVLRDAELTWSDETLGGAPLQLQDVEIRVEQLFGNHRFGLRATPPSALALPIDIRGELHGRSLSALADWYGRLYVVVGHADFAALRQWVRLPGQITEGLGGVQAWAEIQGGQLRAVTADVGLSNVRTRLEPQLPQLQLTTLRGRLGWRETEQKLELWARDLMFNTPDGVRLPPADITYSRTQSTGAPVRSEVTFDALDVEALERLIDRLPVDAGIRARLSELKPRGLLQDFHVVWHDRFDLSKAYSVRGGFKNMAWHASGYLPGASNITASLAATEQGGALSGKVVSTQLDMPRVFPAPLPIQSAEVKVKWTMTAGLPRINLERAAFSNPHLSGVVTGTYDAAPDGPGSINLTGSFPQAVGADAWRYVPLIVPDQVRDWLRNGLLAASARDVQFTLRGELRKFPFSVPGTGLFQVQAAVEDGIVQFAPGWPKMQGVRGRLLFRGNRMEIAGTDGNILGSSLRNLTIVIPDLSDRQPVLEARGEAEGETVEFLRFLRESPLRDRVGAFISGMQAVGRGRLSLTVNVPLQHASAAHVSGAYVFADNMLTPGEGLPVLEQLSGRLAFTEDEVSLRDAQARVFGKPARLSVTTEPGAIVRIQGAGQVDAAALRRQFNQPLLARVDGNTDWKLTASMQDHRSEVMIESSLIGLSSSLPPPLYKTAAQRVPLRIERRDAGRAQQDLYAFSYGSALSGQLLADKSGKMRITRGEIVFAERAPAPQRDGVWVTGRLERLDFDQWQDLLSEKSAGTDAGVPWAGLEINARRVRAFSRDFGAMRIDAARKGSRWISTLDSEEATGDIQWLPDGKGTVVGRFSRLELPAPTAEIEPPPTGTRDGKDLPSLDLVANDFRMGTRQLGSLTLVASPTGSDWRIERLELVSPDGSLSVKGVWQAWAVDPRTQVDVKLDVADVGRFFARMELPRGIDGGKAKLEGMLQWSGPPYAMDVPTLSGRLSLSATKGRFVKIDPGIGKLLSVLSLQTLPKMVTLDFRDIFSQGFAFDQISANADIVHGVARTQDFDMRGPAARVEMKGEVNLAAETQQLDVKIFPALSDSIALGTALVNPVVGLGAFVVQKALKDPLSHILSFEYHVTGTWTAPTVAKRKHEPAPHSQAGRK